MKKRQNNLIDRVDRKLKKTVIKSKCADRIILIILIYTAYISKITNMINVKIIFSHVIMLEVSILVVLDQSASTLISFGISVWS